jgi:hypothetical protein
MPDRKKLEVLASFFGGFPDHVWVNRRCSRCGIDPATAATRARCGKQRVACKWDPWTRLDDVFDLVQEVEALGIWIHLMSPSTWRGRREGISELWFCSACRGNSSIAVGRSESPAGAIAEALYGVALLEKPSVRKNA